MSANEHTHNFSSIFNARHAKRENSSARILVIDSVHLFGLWIQASCLLVGFTAGDSWGDCCRLLTHDYECIERKVNDTLKETESTRRCTLLLCNGERLTHFAIRFLWRFIFFFFLQSADKVTTSFSIAHLTHDSISILNSLM